MKFATEAIPRWLKQATAIAALVLALPGLPIGFGLLCLTAVLVLDNESEAVSAGLIGFTLIGLTVGAGGAIFWHSTSSLQGKISKPLYLPPAWRLVGAFALYVAIGAIIFQSNFVAGLFFPPTLIVAAALPPLAAVSWFMNQQPDRLTWRRAVVVFAGGITLSIFLAVLLQVLFLVAASLLVSNPIETMIDSFDLLFEVLVQSGTRLPMISRSYFYVFVQIAIIFPLVGEFAKPLVTLPLLGYLSRRETFLVGAIAGAGFATLENIFFAGSAAQSWAGILILLLLGGAIHPLCSGLVALGWRGILRGESNAWLNWLARFGIAVALHALWYAGFLLIFSVARANPSEEFFSVVNVIGEPTTGIIVLLLIGLGLVALWIGRSGAQQLKQVEVPDDESDISLFTSPDRAMAIWALSCLIIIVPAGITGLRILLNQ